ncbi:MAG: hypothetical protein A2073_03845 [Deltaproteobacteria bacterium GWC2_42_11]|nr:MAG: hypothetical protein A2073_03845 [Deltaproteobacteria bacterium GWC2_42_11]HBO84087.1 hypothetical protein [Deltaproteobacteria bacterium]
MKRVMLSAALLIFLATPFLSACESQKLQQENTDLKKQVGLVTSEKQELEAKVKELSDKNAELNAKVSELTAKVDELTKAKEKPKAKKESKAKPAKKK